jgi:hypothetical protein
MSLSSALRSMQYVPLKCQHVPKNPYTCITQKNNTDIFTAVRTSKLKTERIEISTVIPQVWSIIKTEKELEASNYIL